MHTALQLSLIMPSLLCDGSAWFAAIDVADAIITDWAFFCTPAQQCTQCSCGVPARSSAHQACHCTITVHNTSSTASPRKAVIRIIP